VRAESEAAWVRTIALYLKRDKIVHFIHPASKNQIPNIDSYPMSNDNLKYSKARICDIGACMEVETRNKKQEMSLFTAFEV
jgi:hypothetical protein